MDSIDQVAVQLGFYAGIPWAWRLALAAAGACAICLRIGYIMGWAAGAAQHDQAAQKALADFNRETERIQKARKKK